MTLVRTIANGALAGLAGTAAMTVAQEVEMRLSGRDPSLVPGHVASKLLPVSPSSDEELARVSLGMHWAHGVTQGVVRALLGRAGLGGVAHFALMWPSDALLYRSLGISDWPWRWSAAELAPDLGHKAIHVAVTNAVYRRLEG